MIEYITRLKCDGCGKTEEEPDMAAHTDLLWWASRHGWWIIDDERHHYCGSCKLGAKLALEILEATR